MASDPTMDDDNWDLIPDNAPVKFDSAEHADIPSQCKLRLTMDATNALNGNELKATLWPLDFKLDKYQTGDRSEKRVPLTLAKIIAFAGDFYTSEPFSHPISYGKTVEERQRRFIHGVKTLMYDTPGTLPGLDSDYMTPEVGMINKIMGEAVDDKTTDQQLQDSGVHQIMQNYKGEKNGYMPLTSQFLMIGKTRYGDILIYNMDHFGDYAWSCYRAGHAEALRIAKDGVDIEKHGDSTDLKNWHDKPIRDDNGKPKNLFKDKDGKPVNLSKEDRLKLAYFYDAFALHYLSDQFASGHTRCPRMEMNKPLKLITTLTLANTVSGLFKFSKLRPCRGGWDGMTGFLHDLDGTTGLRVHNKRGDEWIAYGDAEYFLECNRINRLKSIECCQRSLNEIYETWRTGEYPSKCMENGKFNPNSDSFDALELVPIPGKPIIEQQTESDGNPSILWVIKQDTDESTAQELTEDPPKGNDKANEAEMNAMLNDIKNAEAQQDKEDREISEAVKNHKRPNSDTVRAPPAKAPIGSGIDGDPTDSENGFFFGRRVDVDNCSVTKYQWGSPGVKNGFVSSDVVLIERSWFMADKLSDQARSLEILSGGFIQVQEYQAKEGEKVNYGVNVWGPVQVPIEFKPYPADPKDAKKATTQTVKPAAPDPDKFVPSDRQMTFTWRGRRTKLYNTPEVLSDSKILRWHSWFDPVKKQKTSLLKFSFSEKDPANAIVVESWPMFDQSAKTKPNQQWTNYEQMTPNNRLEFGGSNPEDSVNDIKKTVLFPSYTSTDWKNVAHATRFFITPFLKGSSAGNPDIVTFTWKCTDPKDSKKGAQPMISVASTDNLLLNPRVRIPPKAQTLAPIVLDGSTPFRGFVKRFEDVDNTSMILHARATNKDPSVHGGIRVVPQVYEQDGSKDELRSSSDELFMPTSQTPEVDDFYAVLVGDTRLCGHKELVVLAGTHPFWYLRAWELNAEKKWIQTSGPNEAAMKVRPSTNAELSSLRTPKLLMCALMPNEETRNGLNVVLVSSYELNNTKINIRVFIKAGDAVPKEEEMDPTPTEEVKKPETLDGTQKPTPDTTGGSSKTTGAQDSAKPASTIVPSWVMVNWDGDTSTMVPSWVFDPSAKPPTTTSSSSPAIVSGQNSFAKFDQYGSVLSTIGGDDLAYLASDPVPPPGPNPINMGVIAGPGLQSGRTVPMPMPYKAVAITHKTEAGPSKFTTEAPLVTYGRYEAIPCDVTSVVPSYRRCILKWDNQMSSYTLSPPNGSGQMRDTVLLEEDADGAFFAVSSQDPVLTVGKDWTKDTTIEVEYFFDTSTKKSCAVMYKRSPHDRFRILNPSILFQSSTQAVVRTRAPKTPASERLPLYPPINMISTAYEKPKPKDRASAGWKDFIDCAVEDPLAKNPHFHMVGWRMCKVASVIRGVPMWGIMNIFSFHGVIGCRVWAPREPGEYDRWVCRGMNPYMGQTSLGTGYNSTGLWNDNVAHLSWGPTEDFADMNVWNEKTQSWSEVPNLDQVKYARGFEVKDPYDHKTIYLEAEDILPNIPIVSAIPGLVAGVAAGVAGGVASVASILLSSLFGWGS